jgi:FAD/FMN-containing dehydrogenase
MSRTPSRRDVLRLAGFAGVASVVASCTGSTSPAKSSASTAAVTSSSAPPTPATSASTSAAAARPTYAALARQLPGRLARPGQATYKPAALLYNPRFANQPKPQAIAYCASPSDVVDCVRFAAAGGAALRIRNGGHSYGGWSSGPGLVADLAALKSVHVDHSAMTATVGAGALLADVYSALDAKGVSIGAGSCATVGVTGLTLGGGVGLLTRLYGLTCDQLVAAAVVTADAKQLTVSAKQHPDLFWALRGGGGSFAAVTSLTFKVRTAPRVQQVFLQWPGSDAAQVLAAWQQWTHGTPHELWSTCKILARPGEGVRTVIAAFWTGPGSPAKQIDKLLKATPPPSTNSPTSDAYLAAMLGAAGCDGSASACIAAALTPAQRQPEAAASSILQKPLPDKAIHALASAVEGGLDVAGMIEGGVSFDALGGAVAEVAADGTAFPWRAALADIQYTATWPYAKATAHPSRYDAFVQKERASLVPYVGASGYANYADPSLRDYATAYWGPNLNRLSQVKKTYDPHNVFSFPQAVPL